LGEGLKIVSDISVSRLALEMDVTKFVDSNEDDVMDAGSNYAIFSCL
jgi:hypothetical protein